MHARRLPDKMTRSAIALFAGVGLLLALVPARTLAAADLEHETQFDIPAQKLPSALLKFSEQSGVQVTSPGQLVEGKTTAGVIGTYSASTALAMLLKNTALNFATVDGTTVIITDSSASRTSQIGAKAGAADAVRLAANTDSASATSAGGRRGSSDDSDSVLEEVAIKGIPEILVSGSRQLNMDIRRSRDDAQPYVIFDRETIADSGAVNVEDFLKQRLTMETTSVSESQAGSFLGTRSSINLRGLGADQTLILIDGHRMAGALAVRGIYQPDINGLPLSAIERIEILPTSASGIYGGSATGGVVNIVLRHDYSGVETKLTYDNTFDSSAQRRRIDLNGGFALEGGRTSVLFAGSYSDGDNLLARDRHFVTADVQRVLRNNPNFIDGLDLPGFARSTPVGRTPNIRSADGSDLILKYGTTPLNSPITFVPEGYAGLTSDNGLGLVANAGSYNVGLANSLNSGLRPLLSTPTVESLQLTLRREFTSSISAFLEAGGSNNVSETHSVSMSGSFRLAASNPNNPFTSDIRVTAPLVGLDGTSVVDSHDRRLVTGVIAKLAHNWTAEADVGLDRSRFASHSLESSGDANFFIADPAQDAVDSGTLDVIRDLNVSPPDFSQYINRVTQQLPTHAKMKDYTVRASGPVYTLPSGPINLSMQLERREETFEPSVRVSSGLPPLLPSGNQANQSQDVNSAYLEAVVPLVGAQNHVTGIHTLELQVAGRWDDYKSSGTNFVLNPTTPVGSAENKFNSTDTTLALRYSPVEDVMLRASYSTGFLPPAVNNLVPTVDSLPGFLVTAVTQEPAAAIVTTLGDGNPNLKPETSESWSAGLVLRPRFLEGLRLSIDWFRIDKRDNIVTPDLFSILFDTQGRFPGRVLRNTAGEITTIDFTSINIAKSMTEGYDLALDYAFPRTRYGDFQLFALGTITEHYRTQDFPGDPQVEHVGLITSQSLALSPGNYPLKFKGNLGLTWSFGQWTAGWTMRYFDSYRIDGDQVFGAGGAERVIAAQGHGGRVASQDFHDLYATYRIDSASNGGFLANTEWQLGIRNVFNTAPGFDVSNAFGGYYSGYADPRLASYYISARKRF